MSANTYCIGYLDNNEPNCMNMIFKPVIRNIAYLDIKSNGFFEEHDFVRYVYHKRNIDNNDHIDNQQLNKIFDNMNLNVYVKMYKIGNIKKMNNDIFKKEPDLIRKDLKRKKIVSRYVMKTIDDIFYLMTMKNVTFDFYNFNYDLYESVLISGLYFIIMSSRIENEILKKFNKVFVVYNNKVFCYIIDIIPLGE